MKETVLTIAKWHEETFPDATLRDQLLKFEEEKKRIFGIKRHYRTCRYVHCCLWRVSL